MKFKSTHAVVAFAVTLPILIAAPARAQHMMMDGMNEAVALQTLAATQSGRPAYSPMTAVKFKSSDNVFLKSALEVNFTYRAAFVTLPLFRGRSPKGEPVDYIITEASDFDVAKKMGLNYSPKMKHAVGAGAQMVTLDGGVMQFKGDVDFSPEHLVVAGSMAMPFPPRIAKAGAVSDAQWSSMVVMPSGGVLNVQMVHNASGTHDRAKSIDLQKRTVTLSLLDGFQGGNRTARRRRDSGSRRAQNGHDEQQDDASPARHDDDAAARENGAAAKGDRLRRREHPNQHAEIIGHAADGNVAARRHRFGRLAFDRGQKHRIAAR